MATKKRHPTANRAPTFTVEEAKDAALEYGEKIDPTKFSWTLAQAAGNPALAWIGIWKFLGEHIGRDATGAFAVERAVTLPPDMALFLFHYAYGLSVLASGQHPYKEHESPADIGTVKSNITPTEAVKLLPSVLGLVTPGDNAFSKAKRQMERVLEAMSYKVYREKAGLSSTDAVAELNKQFGAMDHAQRLRRVKEGDALLAAGIDAARPKG